MAINKRRFVAACNWHTEKFYLQNFQTYDQLNYLQIWILLSEQEHLEKFIIKLLNTVNMQHSAIPIS